MSNASAVAAATRARSNGERLAEIKARLDRLARREPVTPQDVHRARTHAQARGEALAAARTRLMVMRRSSAMRHESYAEVLSRAGRVACAGRERDAARQEYELIERSINAAETGGSSPVAALSDFDTRREIERLRDALAALLAWTGGADLDEVDRRKAWCHSIVEQCRQPQWRGWLQAVCCAGASLLAGVRGIAVTVAGNAGVEFAATSDDWVSTVHQLELVVGEGPSESARKEGRVVAVYDLATERAEWQGYASATAGRGVRGIWALPLRVQNVSVGALTFYYGSSLVECASGDLDDALAFADIASAAVLADIEQIGNGGPAGHELFVVHVAAGSLVARLGISPQEADARLRAFAFSAGERLEEVARRVLEGEDIP